MARRGGTARFRCTEPDCTEVAFYEYTSNADYGRLSREQKARPWQCSRHRNPEQLITPDQRVRTVVLIADKSKRFPDPTTLFWRRDGDADVGSGFLFGPGFKAHADDFPEGSRITITITADVASEGT